MEVNMVKTITERFDKDGKLVERVTVEEMHEEESTWPRAWWGIIPPPKWGSQDKTISTGRITIDSVGTGGSLVMNTGGSITVRA